MSDEGNKGMDLPELDSEIDLMDPNVEGGEPVPPSTLDAETGVKTAPDLEAIFDVPVNVSAVLGRTEMGIGDLLKLAPGAVLELDRKVGEAIDIFVNERLVARGEVVLVDDKLGITMTEIIKTER